MERLVPLLGLFIFLGLAALLSDSRKSIVWLDVGKGLFLLIFTAILVLGIPSLGIPGPLQFLFNSANAFVDALLSYSEKGSRFVFGDLLDTSKFGFIFAFQVLPTIIFVASLMAILYHVGVMQKIVYAIAVFMQKFMRVSGAESLSTAANIFVGQTEAPLVIRPYLGKMTRSELYCVMVGGMASVAGGVLAAFVGMLHDKIPNIAGHLITASVLSGPATLMISKMILPEREKPETLGRVPKKIESGNPVNLIEAAASGATEGLSLSLNVATMLIAFIALIALSDAVLGWLGTALGFSSWGQFFVPEIFRSENGSTQLSLELILGWLMSPLAWLMGVPWSEAPAAGALLGQKVVLNEFVAYMNLAQWGEKLSERSLVVLSYALCGFANFSSIGIQIGGIGSLVPERRKDLARLGLLTVAGGSLCTFIVACVAALLI